MALIAAREPVVASMAVDAMPRRRGAADVVGDHAAATERAERTVPFRAGGGPGQVRPSTTGGLRQFGEHVLHELDLAVSAGRA